MNSQKTARRRGPGALGSGVALVVSTMLAACSALSPQVFSPQLLIDPNGQSSAAPLSKSPATLAEAYSEAEAARARYITALQSQANASPQLAAGLIGLSALTLFKATTGASAGDAAGAGALAGAGWAYNNTLLPKARLDVFRAGADALTCAMAATDPYRRGQALLVRPEDGVPVAGSKEQGRSLYLARADIQGPLAELHDLLVRHKGLTGTVLETIPARDPIKPKEPPPGCIVRPNATADVRLVFEKDCRAKQAAWDKRIVPGVAGRQNTLVPTPEVQQAFASAHAELVASDHALLRATRAIEALEAAGPALWTKTVQIQLQVSAEIDKTVPDPASVLAAVQGMGSVAHAVASPSPIKLDFIKPGDSQGVTANLRKLDQANEKALGDIDTARDKLRAKRVALQILVADAVAPSSAKSRNALKACTVKLSAVVLRVTPADAHVSVAAGGSQSFFVSGGSGLPIGKIESDGKAGTLSMVVEGGQFRFDYKASDVTAGDTVTLQFSDGAGQAEHQVELSIVAPAVKPSDKPDDTLKTSREQSKLMRDELDGLNLTSQSTPEDFQKAIDRCQAKPELNLKPTRVYDQPTAAANLAGKCKA